MYTWLKNVSRSDNHGPLKSLLLTSTKCGKESRVGGKLKGMETYYENDMTILL